MCPYNGCSMEPQTQPQIPPTVAALKQLEAGTNPLPQTPNPTPPTTKTVDKWYTPLLSKWQKVPLWGKVATVGLTLVACLGLTMLTMMLTAIDTKVFQLVLDGQVVSEEGKPVANAVVTLDGKPTQTNSEGRFNFPNLEIKRYQIEIVANGYESFRQEVVISRSFLSYTNNRVFTLKQAGEASLVGKLKVLDNPQYNFVDDYFQINSTTYSIKTTGEFELTNLSTGKVRLEFVSSKYKDLVWDIDLQPGQNNLNTEDLTPTGDIVGSLQTWLREDVAGDLQITVEGVPATQIVLDKSKGTFKVKDLEVARKYKVRTQAQGYITRDYEVSISQGENQVFGFQIVEERLIPFMRKVDRENQVAISELDGKNPQIKTTGNDQIVAPTLVDDVVYYLSDRDNVISDIGGKAYTVYVVSLKDGSPQRVTVNAQKLGNAYPFFAAEKIANIRKGSTATSRVLEVMNLDGTNRVVVKEIAAGQFGDVLISQDGQVIYYYLQSSDQNLTGLYRAVIGGTPVKLSSKANTQLYSVSSNGDKLLYSAKNASSGQDDLLVYTNSTGQDSIIRPTFVGRQPQFIAGSDTKVIYALTKDGASNIFQLDLLTNAETALTKFPSAQEGVEGLYQQGNLIMYETNKALYALDPSQPKHGKQVTTDFVRYSGYSL